MNKHKLILTVTSLIVTFFANAHDFEVDGIYYNFMFWNNNEVEITYKGDAYDAYQGEYSGSLNIPSVVIYEGKSYDVTMIDLYAFRDCLYLETVTIPASITYIGGGCFQDCTSLKLVDIEANIDKISSSCFEGCTSLESVKIPESVTTLDSFCFEGCTSLTSVTIPESVITIGFHSFYGCSSLTSIAIPEGVTTLGTACFSKCSSLTAIKIPGGIHEIPAYCFEDCSSLSLIDFGNGVETIGSKALRDIADDATIIIPPSMKSIAEIGYFYYEELHVKAEQTVIIFSENLTIESARLANYYILSSNIPTFKSGLTYNSTLYVTHKFPQYNSIVLDLGSADNPIQMSYKGKSLNVDKYIREHENLKKLSEICVNNGINMDFASQWNKNAGTHSGQCEITFKYNTYSSVSAIDYYYKIEPKDLVLRISDASKTYRDENPSFTYTISGQVSGETEDDIFSAKPKVWSFANSSSNAGVYAITSDGGETINYKVQVVNGTLTINKAQLEVRALNHSRDYGENNPEFQYTIDGFVGNESCESLNSYPQLSCDAQKTSHIGDYPIRINFNNRNYQTTCIGGTLTVNAAPIDIQISDAMITYGDNIPMFSLKYKGLKNDESFPEWDVEPIAVTSAVKGSDVGAYNVILQAGKPKNYKIENITEGTLTINKKVLTVKPLSMSRIYGEDNPALECEYSGFVLNEYKSALSSLAILETTATKLSDVGTYPIIAKDANAHNYSFEYLQGELSIIKANQTINWSQEFGTMHVGRPIELYAACTSNLPIEYVSSNEDIAIVEMKTDKASVKFLNPGKVTITAQQSGNLNYHAAISKDMELFVVQDAKSIELSKYALKLNETDSYKLIAKVLPSNTTVADVVWSSSDESVAVVENGVVTALNRGEAIISTSTTDGTNLTANCRIDVVKLVRDIIIEEAAVEFEVGETL